MWSDLSYAVRQLRKSPGFTLTAVLTLALGDWGEHSDLYADRFDLLRPLPFPQQERLMRIGYGASEKPLRVSFPRDGCARLGEHSASFESVSGFGADAESNVGDADRRIGLFGATVMVNALDTLGVHPALGRFFSAEDARAGRIRWWC